MPFEIQNLKCRDSARNSTILCDHQEVQHYVHIRIRRSRPMANEQLAPWAIPQLPTSFYYIPNFITPDEEAALLSKARSLPHSIAAPAHLSRPPRRTTTDSSTDSQLPIDQWLCKQMDAAHPPTSPSLPHEIDKRKRPTRPAAAAMAVESYPTTFP